MDSSRGYSSYQYGAHYVAEQSTLEKITAKVYQAKLKVNKTLKKPEDEHLVASDAELDAKLETYRHVHRSCNDLQRIVSAYATRIYALAQAENELGRFLKQQGERDRTRAGKMMQATGKSLSCASQQRLALRVPLTRLGGEVETFANRAVSDCESKVTQMEEARSNYRSSLLWMKDVSERLDPEAYNRLEKFRKVQAQVKRSKDNFDKVKLDAMQKVDLLVASRCNMFSRVLVLYQQTIIQFSHKTARILCAVADAFKGYQYFEFNMLRELTDCTRKLARETSNRPGAADNSDADADEAQEHPNPDIALEKLDELFSKEYREDEDPFSEGIDLTVNAPKKTHKEVGGATGAANQQASAVASAADALLLEGLDLNATPDADRALLNDLFGASDDTADFFSPSEPIASPGGTAPLMTSDFASMFGGASTKLKTADALLLGDDDPWNSLAAALPSRQMDTLMQPQSTSSGTPLINSQQVASQPSDRERAPPRANATEAALLENLSKFSTRGSSQTQAGPSLSSLSGQRPGPTAPPASAKPSAAPKKDTSGGKKEELVAWFNMFADLDPLANPDKIGRKPEQDDGFNEA